MEADSGPIGSLSPFRILRVLRKKWLTVGLVTLFALTAAAYYLVNTQKLYRASSLLDLSVRRPRIMTQQAAVIEDQASGTQSEEIFNTRLEKFKSLSLMNAAASRLLAKTPAAALWPPRDDGPSGGSRLGAWFRAPAATNAVPAAPAETNAVWRKYLEGNLKLTLLRRTRLVRAELDHPDPALAAAACNAFAEAAEASAFDENRVVSDAAVVWLEAQAVAQRKILAATEDLLLKFRQDNKIDVLESQRKTIEDSLLDFNKGLVTLESGAAREADLLAALATLDLTPENAGKLPASTPRQEEIRLALDRWTAAVTERNALLSRYTAKHPEVQAKDALVELHRREALAALDRARGTVTANLALFEKQAGSLQAKKQEQAKAAADLELQIVEKRARLSTLERERDAADQGYRGILNRIQEARMAADENTATVKIVEQAQAPERPVKPRPARVLALALMLGLAGGLGLALLKDSLEDHLGAPHEVEGSGLAKVLAVIPHANTKDRHAIATASATRAQPAIAEAFAGLRAMLDSAQYKDRNRVILLASSVPEEGKTITATNLAITYARHGEKTLLIDFDLRRPRIAGLFPLPAGHRSLPDFLAAGMPEAEIPALPYAAPIAEGLAVMAGRAATHGHAELVNENKLAALIQWARANYDRVILDAPPLGLVSDALALAALADIVLVMARPEVTRKRALWHTLYRFREAGVGLLAAVVNDVDFSKGQYGYGYGYHSYSHYAEYDNVKDQGTV
jgi:capsular exopolysaccharide synthesis family protein